MIAPSRRSIRRLLAAALLGGLALRLAGIDFGFPLLVHSDEGVIARPAAAYGTGTLDPGWYVQGPLTSWLLAGVWGVRFLLLRATGAVAGVDAYKDAFLADPTPFFLWGRIVLGAGLGTSWIWGTWRLGRAVFGAPIAAWGAAGVAVSFLAVREAHFLYVDMGMMACATLSAAAWLSYARTGARRSLLAGAVAFGGAVAFKYNAALLGFLLPVAAAGGPPRGARARLRDVALGCAVAGAVLALGNPFLVLSPSAVLRDLAAEGGKHGAAPPLHHLTYSLAGGVGWPVLLLAFWGAAHDAVRGPARARRAWLLPLGWYAYATLFALPYARYVLPLVPFACLGAVRGAAIGIPPAAPRALFPAVLALAFLPTFAKSVLFDRLLSRPDTRVLLAGWLRDAPEARDGMRITADHTSWVHGAWPTWEFGRTDAQLAALEGNAPAGAASERLARMRRIGDRLGRRRFALYGLLQDGEDPESLGTMARPALPMDPDALDREGIDLLVVSGMHDGAGWERIASRLGELPLLAEFRAGEVPRTDAEGLAGLENAGLPFLWADLVSRRHTGATLRVYRWTQRQE